MKKRLFYLLLLPILVISTMGANKADFSENNWAPGRARADMKMSGPVLESQLNDSSKSMTQDMLVSLLPKMSGDASMYAASKLGLESLMGKKLNVSQKTGADAIVSADNNWNENEPSIAVNPANESIVVAFTHWYGPSDGPCQAMISYDGGVTFNYKDYYFPPMLAGGDFCSDPVVRFSPDGSYVYYSYMDVYNGGNSSKVVMQRAFGYFPNIASGGLQVVFDDNAAANFMDKPWADVHTYDEAVTGGAYSDVVYVTSTKFYGNGDCAIVLNVSYDYGSTWYYSTANPLLLDYSYGCNPVLQGSRPIGGNSGFMLACWYDSGPDGWLAGKFYIDCIANDWFANAAGSWSPYFYPAYKQRYELSYWLGPNENFYRWNGGMFPSMAIDEQGMVYVTFVADPTANQNDAEGGNILLNRAWLDYSISGKWLAPLVVDAGANAQGYPTVAARYSVSTNKFSVYVAYSTHTSGNKKYKTVYRKGTRGVNSTSISFSGQKKVSDQMSMSDYMFIGDYIDSVVAPRRYHVIWTDRADAYGKYDEDDDVMTDFFTP